MTDLPELAISVHAPWAWALMHGGKDVENRSMSSTAFVAAARKGFTGRVWVHASLWPDSKGGPLKEDSRPWRDLEEETDEMLHVYTYLQATELLEGGVDVAYVGVPPLRRLDALRGHIVGSVEVHGYRAPDDPPNSPWYVPGSLAILVRNPRPLAQPVAEKGALGWWRPQGEVLEQLGRAV